MDKQLMKKIFSLSTAAFLSMSITSVALADDATLSILQQISTNTGSSGPILQQIANNTSQTLSKVNDIPGYLGLLGAYMLAWTTPDDSDTTSAIQGNFTALGNLLITNNTAQASLQQRLNADLLVGTSKTNFPAANDVTYSTILGAPYYNPDSRGAGIDSKYNYIKNASGITLSHTLPAAGWRGAKEDQLKYLQYYNTVMAVQSYGGYILSSQYADGNQYNQLQTTLITQASDPQAWFAQVASENIGWVLRQMLMYQSQTFVLMTQMVKTQKDMVSAQVMTNAAIIASSSTAELLLARSAQGIQ